MITIDGRFIAAAFLAASGLVIAAVGVYSYASNRLTGRDVAGLAIAGVVALIAALWLWRHPAHGGQA